MPKSVTELAEVCNISCCGSQWQKKGNLRSILEGDTMSKIKLYDKVRIKSNNIIGFVVDVLNDKEKFIVEKEGNEEPLFFDIDKDDLEVIE